MKGNKINHPNKINGNAHYIKCTDEEFIKIKSVLKYMRSI
jgi:hypothetical protein